MKNKPKTDAARQGFTPAAKNWMPRAVRAKMVGELVPTLMRPAFEKFGFPAAAILTDWAAIAGPELAAFTAPERLKWPRAAASAEGDASTTGATLILRVGGARALEVEHLRSQLIERINASFGYRAVSEIRVVQAPLARKAEDARPALTAGAAEHQALLASLPEDRLKGALSRIAAGIKARQSVAGAS